MTEHETITQDEVETWCQGTVQNFVVERLHEILTGEYPLDNAREDILSFRPQTDEKEQAKNNQFL